jgi:hypothetical protein
MGSGIKFRCFCLLNGAFPFWNFTKVDLTSNLFFEEVFLNMGSGLLIEILIGPSSHSTLSSSSSLS